MLVNMWRNALRLSVSNLTSRRGDVNYLSVQYTLAFNVLKHGHLLDGYLVEFLQTFALRQSR